MKRFLLTMTGVGITATLVMAQTQAVRGTVVDATTGEPIIGANVVIKGQTNIGAATDLDGRFSINAPKGAKTLLITYIGYKSQEVAIGSNLKIRLESDAAQLDDVVVTAVGISRSQKSLGYATQQVKAEDLSAARVADVNNALVGKVSGARFVGGSGATFDPGKIILRGSSSLEPGGSEPIYVVDGVITNKNMVNMDDVESVNVLKGPAATALYGSEGGNGAIIITSKGGKAGEARSEVNVSHSLLVEKAKTRFRYQNEYGGGADGFTTYEWKAGDPVELKGLDGMRIPDYAEDISWGPKFDGKPYIPFYAWDKESAGYGKTAIWEGAGEDNLLNLFQTGITNTTNVSFLRGGKDHLSRISFSNIQRRGIAPNSDAVRRYLTFKTSFSPLKNMNVDLDYKYTYRQNHNAMVEGYGGRSVTYSYTQWFHTNVDLGSPYLKDYKRPDGSLNTWNITSPTDFTAKYHNNPYAMFHEMNQYSTYQWHVFRGQASYQILPSLRAGISVNGNLRQQHSELKIAKGLLGDEVKDLYETAQNRTIDVRTVGSLSYSERFFDQKLTFDANAYVEGRSNRYDTLSGETTDGLSANKFFNLSASQGKPNATNSTTIDKQQSIYGNLIFGWDNVYYLELSGRNDWHSALPKDANSFFYGGVSASALLTNILPKSSVLNFWKVRASIAQVGSTLTAYNIYQTYALGKYGTTTYQNELSTLYNQLIRPTISSSFEVGTEFKMFNNRFWGDINFYSRTAKDQIIQASVTPASGYNTRFVNVGRIRNQGIEISLGGTPIKTKNFEWEVNTNFSKNNNKLLELYGNADDRYRVSWMGFGTKAYLWAEVGRPLGTIRAGGFERSPEGQIVLAKRATANQYGAYGIVTSKSEDLDHGNIQADATGGFSTSLRYKNVSLQASFDWQLGGKIISITNMFGEGSGLLAETAGLNERGVDKRLPLSENGGVRIQGVEAVKDASGKITSYTPVDTYVSAYYYYAVKSRQMGEYVYDASYLKMREISLTYTLPKSFIKKLGFVKAASMSIVATNPWLIWSKTPNIDVSEAGSAYDNFIETGQTVSTSSLGFTLNVTL